MISLFNRYHTLIKNSIPSGRKNLGILIHKHWMDLQDHYIMNLYHDFGHISMGIEELDKDPVSLEFRDEVEFAYFYHDFIVGCRDAEILSSMFALNVRNSMKLSLVPNIIADCIAETKFSNLINCESNKFIELDIIHDIDLVIFGKDRDVFIRYDEGIIQEYGSYFDKNIRSKVLYTFYNNKRIYRTEYFRDLYEIKAKANLKWILNERYGKVQSAKPTGFIENTI